MGIVAHHRAIWGESVSYEQEWAGYRYQVRVDPLQDDAGRGIGCIGAAQTFTEQRKHRRALRNATQTEVLPFERHFPAEFRQLSQQRTRKLCHARPIQEKMTAVWPVSHSEQLITDLFGGRFVENPEFAKAHHEHVTVPFHLQMATADHRLDATKASAKALA